MTASQPPYDDVREEKARDDAAETAADDAAEPVAYIRQVCLCAETSGKVWVHVAATTYSRAGEPDDLEDDEIFLSIGGEEFSVRLMPSAAREKFAAAILKAKPEIIEEETR